MTDSQGQPRQPSGSLWSDFPGGEAKRQQLLAELKDQTPRGVAIIGCSFMEMQLRESIKRGCFVEEKHSGAIIGTIKSGGGIGVARSAQLAFCLGMIREKTLDDIMTIVEIRNYCAHKLEPMSFDDKPVSDLCDRLTIHKTFLIPEIIGSPTTRQDIYLTAVGAIYMGLFMESLRRSAGKQGPVLL